MSAVLLLLPDFALILLGSLLRRWLHLGDHFWSGLEKLIYFVLFPAYCSARWRARASTSPPRRRWPAADWRCC